MTRRGRPRQIGSVLEAYFAKHARCRHCEVNPSMPQFRCCRACWDQLFRGGEIPAPQCQPIAEPVQLTFDEAA